MMVYLYMDDPLNKMKLGLKSIINSLWKKHYGFPGYKQIGIIYRTIEYLDAKEPIEDGIYRLYSTKPAELEIYPLYAKKDIAGYFLRTKNLNDQFKYINVFLEKDTQSVKYENREYAVILFNNIGNLVIFPNNLDKYEYQGILNLSSKNLRLEKNLLLYKCPKTGKYFAVDKKSSMFIPVKDRSLSDNTVELQGLGGYKFMIENDLYELF